MSHSRVRAVQRADGPGDRTYKRAAKHGAERRPLTVMFCDLVGYTGLAQRLDPEALDDLMTVYRRVCRDVVKEYSGEVRQFLGDGVMAYFGTPLAHEDDAERGIRAGWE